MAIFPPSYRYRRGKKGKLIEVPRYLADGKQKKHTCKVVDDSVMRTVKPRSEPLSEEAQLLLWARQGHSEALSQLITRLSGVFQVQAKAKRWQIDLTPQRADTFALICLTPYLRGEKPPGPVKAAKMLGFDDHKSYSAHWWPKREALTRLAASWAEELKGN